MSNKKYSLFPKFSDIESGQEIVDFFLLFLSRFGIPVNLLVMVVDLINGQETTNVLFTNLGLISLHIVAWVLIIKGRGRLAIAGFCAGLWCVLFADILNNGLHQPAYTSLLVPSLLIMLTSKRIWGLYLAMVTVGLGGIIVVLEGNGFLSHNLEPVDSKERFFLVTSSIILLISFLWYFIISAFDSLVEKAKKSEMEQRKMVEKVSIHRKIGVISNSSLVLSEVLDDVTAEIKKLLNFDQLSLFLISQGKVSFVWNSTEYDIDDKILNDVLFGINQTKIITPKRNSSLDKPQITTILEDIGMNSFLFCPIISKGTKLGGIFLYSHTMNAFSEEDKTTIRDIAHQLVGSCLNSQIRQMDQMFRDTELRVLQNAKLTTLGTLATEVAHDINQPLSFVKTLLQCTLEDIENEELDVEGLVEEMKLGEKYLYQISSTISKIRRFVSSNDTGFDTAVVDLNDVLDIALILFRKTIGRQEIDLSVNIAKDIPPISIQESKLEQILINLIQNAIHAMEDTEHKKLSIDITKISEEKIKIIVSDNGKGISEEDLKSIFKPFFSTKKMSGGTGMGLSIVSNILEEMHGSISCSSVLGEGTQFFVELPINSEADINFYDDVTGNISLY